MRIAFVTDAYWPRISGLVISLDAFKVELEARGHVVGIFTNRYSRDDARLDAEAGRSNIHRFSSMPSPVYSPEEHLIAPFAWADFFNGLKHFRPDIVHVQSEFAAGQLGKFFAAYRRVPLVMTSHTHYEHYINNYVPFVPRRLGRLFVRFAMWIIFRSAEELVVPSEHFRHTMVHYGIRPNRIHVIPTGIDLSRFAIDPAGKTAFLAEFHARHPVLPGSRLLLYVGRIGEEKNLCLLLEAMDRILRIEPRAVLLVVGDGPWRRGFHHQAFKHGLQDRVVFTGYVDHWKLKYIYSEAEVFVFPSVSETQGLVTIEAMASGTPVVAVGEMGTVFVMGGDNGGFMVANDPGEFAGRVSLLLVDGELRRRKAAEALEYAARWSIAAMADRLEAVYRRVLERRS